jgi:hypothetical protein
MGHGCDDWVDDNLLDDPKIMVTIKKIIRKSNREILHLIVSKDQNQETKERIEQLKEDLQKYKVITIS